ncbi:MAG: hypothetical protein JO072_10640 [Parafilimonas sp.]|nr:hypothetical protein [Parafilimonas sp.]
MSDSCFKQNELLMPGTRQDNRLQNALDPTYVSADERSVADILVFIANYATLINYYALKSSDQDKYILDGDWKPLIMSDEAFNYAGIAVTPYTFPGVTFYKYVNAYETGSTETKRKQAYRVLWDIIFSIYRDINSFYTALPITMSLRNEIAIEINNALTDDFHTAAAAYLNDATAIPGFNLQVATSAADDDYKFGFANDIINNGFDKVWININADSWKSYIVDLNTETVTAKTFFNTDGFSNLFDSIDYSTLQLKQIFKRAYEAYSRIISRANSYLQDSLQINSAHYAHHGLLLAFIQLFDVLRIDMNGFTRKHLEYYYTKFLKINPAAATADSAHIIFEPAKNVTTHLIEKNTALNAGKDATGKLMLYDTDNEIVVNQATVQQLKALFVEPASSSGVIKNVYASAVANSSDGNGAPFTGDDVSWKAFADVRKNITGTVINSASLGFYIASPILHLTEGKRIVEFEFTVADASKISKLSSITNAQVAGFFDIYFSGEKQWEKLLPEGIVTDNNSKIEFTPPAAGASTFKIVVTLKTLFKPVVGYNPKFCDGNLNTIYPVVKFALKQSALFAYETWKNIPVSQINITTTVSEITNLSLQNDSGVLDATKPIQLFGPSPRINSAFYIGHAELEYKTINSFDVILKWLNYNGDLKNYYSYRQNYASNNAAYVTINNNNDFKSAVNFLRNKAWQTLNSSYSIFEDGETTVMSLAVSGLANALNKPENFIVEKLLYTPQTQNGFISLTLNAPTFGHDIWPAIFAQQTAAVTKDPANNSVPNPPYTPTLQSISLQYAAVQQINFNNPDQGQFFYLTPFGTKELKTNSSLLLAFQYQKNLPDDSLETDLIESSLIIGISNAVINQNISLLLQLSEGTENISINPPAVSWNYLSTSGWKNFDQLLSADAVNYLLSDATNNLIKSGIVQFRVPFDIDLNTTELPAGLAWISASVQPDLSVSPNFSSDGLPKMIGVYANAVKSTFVNNANDPEHLAAPLGANKITRLYNSDAAVKKISQPYPSFGGKKTESGNTFYTRVSERLRHKHRAITIWDYERLVLNEFPEVYMVKCLNHTGYGVDCSKSSNDPSRKIYRENIPGKVMLITIPFVTNLQSGNKYQPALSAAVLKDITDFIHGSSADACKQNIKALNCGCAEFKVENPQYETISVSCKIKVKDCLDVNFYQKQLSDDLKNFLSPWLSGDVSKINFGGRLHVSQVIYFIEQLSYIDYLTNATIQHKQGNTVVNTTDPSLAIATTSRSILTSDESHTIQLV